MWRPAPKPQWRSKLEYFTLGFLLGTFTATAVLWRFGFTIF